MKQKVLWLTAAFVSLGMFSCQKDVPVPAQTDAEALVPFNLTVSLPSQMATRAGTYLSHKGGVSNVNPANYELRFIMEVYDDSVCVYKDIQLKEVDEQSATFEGRLVPKAYKFVFWADITANSEDDLYYDTSNGLTAITYKKQKPLDVLANYDLIDAMDAYTAFENFTVGSVANKSITLTRPFGKYRVIAQDNTVDIQKPTKSVINYDSSIKVPGKYNASDGSVSELVALNDFNFTPVYGSVQFLDQSKANINGWLMGMDYIFAPEAPGQTAINFDLTTSAALQDKNIGFPNIPIERNKLTTIMGYLFTKDYSYTVTVEDEFEGEDIIELPDAASLSSAIQGGGTVHAQLTEDLTLSDATTNKVPANSDINIDLNGHELRTTSPGYMFQLGESGSDLTLTGGTLVGKNRSAIAMGNLTGSASPTVADDLNVVLNDMDIKCENGTQLTHATILANNVTNSTITINRGTIYLKDWQRIFAFLRTCTNLTIVLNQVSFSRLGADSNTYTLDAAAINTAIAAGAFTPTVDGPGAVTGTFRDWMTSKLAPEKNPANFNFFHVEGTGSIKWKNGTEETVIYTFNRP